MDKVKVAYHDPAYYYLNRLMSYGLSVYWFLICIGSRGRGKTTAAWVWVLKRFINHNEKFIWLRLTEAPIKKASRDKGKTLVPQFVMDNLHIDDVYMRGMNIYIQLHGAKEGKLCGVMDCLSTYYNSKGLTMDGFDNIVFDEINRESEERNTFDVIRAFINQVETISRMRHIRFLMMGNTISDTSEILSLFKFQPRTFGLYKLTRRHCIIDYQDDSPEFKARRANSMAGTLLKDAAYANASFVNKTAVYDKTIKLYNENKPVYNFYIGEAQRFGIYKENDGLLVGDVRVENIPAFKISPYINCAAIFNQEVYKDLFDLLTVNNLYFENLMIRSIFIKALKQSKSALL